MTTEGSKNEIFIGIVCRPFSLPLFRLPKSSSLRKIRSRTGRSENICTRVEREREPRATRLVVCSSPLSDFACERSRDTEIHSEREKRWLKRRRAGEWGRKDEEERESGATVTGNEKKREAENGGARGADGEAMEPRARHGSSREGFLIWCRGKNRHSV